MATLTNAREVTRELCKVRQVRQYRPEPVPDDVVAELLEIARWTGSSRNTQPWHFIVVTDKEQLRQISRLRTPINWLADAPLAIAIVLEGASEVGETYDEGRVTERLLIGAHLLGLGGGTAWFGDASQQQQGKEILGIPAERTARSVVALGYPSSTKDPRPGAAAGGRKPLAEIVSYGRMGQSKA
jgi:nitroreductase